MPNTKSSGSRPKLAAQGAILKKARKDKSLKQREIAVALGHKGGHVGRYQNWERGENRPDMSEFPALSAILGIDAAALYMPVPEQSIPQSVRRQVVDASIVRAAIANIRRELDTLEQLAKPLASVTAELKYSKAERSKKKEKEKVS